MPDIRTSERYTHRSTVGLPGEEHALLKTQQNAVVLNVHLEDVYRRHHMGQVGPFRRPPKPDNGPYVKLAGLPSETARRQTNDSALRKSQTAQATRKALGPSFYPTDYVDDGRDYTVPRLANDWYHSNEPEGPIPENYIQEFNRMWYEDDEDNDADQLLADLTHNAPWRTHLPPSPGYGHLPLPHEVMSNPLDRPATQSAFSWSSSSQEDDESSRKETKARRASRGERAMKAFRNSIGRICDRT